MAYYHCSPTSGLTVLEPRKPDVFDKAKSVYMTTSLPMALLYGIRNFEYTYGYTKAGQIYYEEYFPDALRILYQNKCASLYLCDPIETDNTNIPNEAVSKETVPVVEETTIPNVYEALLEQERLGALIIRRHNEIPPRMLKWIEDTEADVIREKNLLQEAGPMADYMKMHYPSSWAIVEREARRSSMYEELTTLMASINVPWAVCGGDAIDLFMGRQTRFHKDIDVAALWDDREKIIQGFLDAHWRVFEPDGGLLREICSLGEDLRTEDNLWCIRPETVSYTIVRHHDNYYEISTDRENQDILDYVEVLFNRVMNGQFLYKRNPSICLDNYLYHSESGIPYLAPEMVLLYKSIFVRYTNSPEETHRIMVENYRHDFDVAVEKMTKEQRQWLENALLCSYPHGHEWIGEL